MKGESRSEEEKAEAGTKTVRLVSFSLTHKNLLVQTILTEGPGLN